MTVDQLYVFYKRNFKVYAIYQTLGIYKFKDIILKKTPLNVLKILMKVGVLAIDFFVFRNVRLPYIEVSITTRCSLKCKDCYYYIPSLTENEQISMTFEEFKPYIDNLLINVKALQTLSLQGGEPLLNKDLPKMLSYVLANKKIKEVHITTNGTIVPSDETMEILSRFRKKGAIRLSNYSQNKALLPRLKIEEILSKVKKYDVIVVNQKFETSWVKVSPINNFNRPQKTLEQYFLACGLPCVHIMGPNLYVCPRAAVYTVKGIYPIQSVSSQTTGRQESISLSKPVSKSELINFYSNKYFYACNFCAILEDNNKERIITAIQL
jgi:organic radical activating enzyme